MVYGSLGCWGNIKSYSIACDDGWYGFIAQAFLHYLGSLKICVPEIFDGDKFEEKLDEPGSKIRLLEIWKLFFFSKKSYPNE